MNWRIRPEVGENQKDTLARAHDHARLLGADVFVDFGPYGGGGISATPRDDKEALKQKLGRVKPGL